MSEANNRYFEIDITARGQNLHDTLSKAIIIAKACGSKIDVKFPKGYSIPVWPESHLEDIKKIEEQACHFAAVRDQRDEAVTNLALCRQTLQEFIDKVDTGGARSTKSYNRFKEVLEKTK